MISEQPAIPDYETPHPHILYAKQLEEHLDMFGIFKIQNDHMIILCYSAAVSLALSGHAMFQYSDLDRILGHIEKDTRTKVIHYLKKHKWLVDNVTSYELSEAARKFLNFASGHLLANDLSISQELNLSRKQAELSEDYNLNEEQSMMHFKISFSGLYQVAERLRQILQKKSRRDIVEIINSEGKKILRSIEDIRNILRKKHAIKYDFKTQQEYFSVVSDIMQLVPQILIIGKEEIQANSKSIGKYITMTMVEDYLSGAGLEELVELLTGNFATPRVSQQLNEQALKLAAIEFLNQVRDYSEPTPPPVIVDFEEEDMVVNKRENPLEILYQELCLKMANHQERPLEDVLFGVDDTFGYAVHRTGQFIKLYDDLLKEANEGSRRNILFQPRITTHFIDLIQGPIERMSESYIRKEVKDE